MIDRFLPWAAVSIACAVLFPSCRTERGKPDLEKEGGTAITLRVGENMDEHGRPIAASQADVDVAIEAIERRLELAGIQRFAVAADAGNHSQINVRVPPLDDGMLARVRELLGTRGRLELIEVNRAGSKPGQDGRSLAQRVAEGDEIVPGYRACIHKLDDADGNPITEFLLLSRRAALESRDIELATVNSFQANQVDVRLSGDGKDKMIALTRAMTVGVDRIAIVVDGEIMSAPVVQAAPLGRNFVITGLDGKREAENFAHALNAPLPVPLSIEKVEEVAPTHPGG